MIKDINTLDNFVVNLEKLENTLTNLMKKFEKKFDICVSDVKLINKDNVTYKSIRVNVGDCKN